MTSKKINKKYSSGKKREGAHHQTVNATVFLYLLLSNHYRRLGHGLWSPDVREPLV